MSLIVGIHNHGFVKLRNIAGPTRRSGAVFDADDIDPANAARMSFDAMDKGRSREDDLRLADYLMRHWHTSPFEQIEVWCEMKLPIFVAREFVRHRTTSLNEISGRYVTLQPEWFIHDVVHARADNVKQGRSCEPVPIAKQEWFKEELNAHSRAGFDLYLEALGAGIAPEVARIALGLNHYTHWLWKQDLHNFMHFLALRTHESALLEAQDYARALEALIRQFLPHSMMLFDKYRRKL